METIKCQSCGAVEDVKPDVSECGWCGDKIDVKAASDNYMKVVKSKIVARLL